MSEFKPCPKCGSCDLYSSWVSGDRNVVCNGCGYHEPENDWNTRHIPEGYALVPVEPTLLMLERGQGPKGYTMDGYPNAHSLADKWKAMVQAAQDHNEC